MSETNEIKAAMNTDREIWREALLDHYSPSIHVTQSGAIGINVGGNVIVKKVQDWHNIASDKLIPLADAMELVEALESIKAAYLRGVNYDLEPCEQSMELNIARIASWRKGDAALAAFRAKHGS